MSENELREVTNPSDPITVDYSDKDAARVAVLFVGRGHYGIDGDDGLPLLFLGGADEWAKQEYGKLLGEFCDSIPRERIIAALESFKNVRERSSMNDIVGNAHEIAKQMKGQL